MPTGAGGAGGGHMALPPMMPAAEHPVFFILVILIILFYKNNFLIDGPRGEHARRGIATPKALRLLIDSAVGTDEQQQNESTKQTKLSQFMNKPSSSFGHI